MADRGPVPIAQIFAGLVPAEVAAAYERLLDADGVAEEDAGEFLGGDKAVRMLINLGMARAYPPTLTRPASLGAVSPELAIQAVLADLHARVLGMQQLLLDGTRRSAEVHRSHQASGMIPAHLVEVITDRDEIMRVSATLVNSARTDWMTFETLSHDMQLSDQTIISVPKALGDRIRRRAIYDQPFIDDPAGRRVIGKCVASGEDARVRPQIRMKMQLADTSAVLLPLTVTGTGGAMLIHAEPVVAGMREFFELVWERATPVKGPAPNGNSPLNRVQQQVLDLLAQGHQDDQIARKIGISDTSVRRHVAAIEKLLEAKTRFEAGVTAQRLGWVG